MAEEQGQEPGTPTGEEQPGQEQQAATPVVDETQAIIDAAAKAGEPATPEGEAGEQAEEEGKPAPYDQDPKWLAARAAQKSLDDILSEHDIEDADALRVMLDNDMKLSEILGDRDAKQLVQDADTLKQYQAYWAEQERLKEEEELNPDERADKYKKELEDHKRQQAEKEAAEGQVEGAKAAIQDFNTRVEGVVEKHGFDEDTAEFAKMYLGVNNPFNEVDIFDKKAVRIMADEGIIKVDTFLANVRQKAIDDYVAGKSEITPITPTETPEKEAVKKKDIPKDASVDEVFAAARDELLEVITGGTPTV